MKTILLVEDAADLARVVRRELEAAGYRVLLAGDGLAALRLQATERPDLIVLDWMLPELDGLEVLRRLRAGSITPVLMLTARTEETDRVVGLELGADDYVTKPFSMRELLARVRALLRRVEQMQHVIDEDRTCSGGPLVWGSLCLDPEAQLATLDGALVELTRSEFSLLYLLLRNPGRVFSRTYLLDAMRGDDYVAGDRSIDNVILRVRKKLGAAGEAIETVWGVGYRLRREP